MNKQEQFDIYGGKSEPGSGEHETVDLDKRETVKKLGLGIAAITSVTLGLNKMIGEIFKRYLPEQADQAESDENDKPNAKTEKHEKTEKEKRMEIAEQTAKEILRVFETKEIQQRFDSKVLSTDFFMAQQFQESRYDTTAESDADARGVYQNKACSIQDVVDYLNFLRNSEKIPARERCDYNGPKAISEQEANDISLLFKNDTGGNYGRAIGKLYLQAIHDKKSKFNISPNKDVFRGKSCRDQQDLLLLAYHDGPARRFDPKNASREGKKYLKLVRKHMKLIAELRDRLQKKGLSRKLNYAIVLLMRELEKGESKANPDKVIEHYLELLKAEHEKEWKKNNRYNVALSDEIVNKLFKDNPFGSALRL